MGFKSDEEVDIEDNVGVTPETDAAKIIQRGVKIWEHYRPCLFTNFAKVSHLCSQNLTIIKHAEDPDNRDTENLLAVDNVIKHLILKSFF